MDIEVVTTKKKLTKSLIDQMLLPNLESIKAAEVLGFVVTDSKRAILKSGLNYYAIPLNYKKGSESIYRTTAKGYSSRVVLKHGVTVDEWWDAYVVMRDKALERQIYI